MVALRFAFAAVSDVGLVRQQNEDGILAAGIFIRDGKHSGWVETDADSLLFAVADGVGGAPAGEVASEFVLGDLARRLSAAPDAISGASEHGVAAACHDTDAALRSRARKNPAHMGMSTTCTGVFVSAGGALWFNAGDSRLYRIRGTAVRQISTDHTLREEMQNPSIPGNIITNCFGMEGFRVDVSTLDLAAGDLLLICSDGLSDYTGPDRLATTLSQAGARLADTPADGAVTSLEVLADELAEQARDGGGGDNISALLIKAVPANG